MDLLDTLRWADQSLPTVPVLKHQRFMVEPDLTVEMEAKEILRQDMEQQPDGFPLLLQNGLWPHIRPARRDWSAVPEKSVKIPLGPSGNSTVGWPPSEWQTLTPKNRSKELLRLAELLEAFWTGKRQPNAQVLLEKYYAFCLPGSSSHPESELCSLRQKLRQHELSSRRRGEWDLINPDLLTDQPDTARQLPQQLLSVLRQAPVYQFKWKPVDPDEDAVGL